MSPPADPFTCQIRAERAADQRAVFELHAAAFETPAEARLVDCVRQRESPLVSLVAEVEGEVVGHILFSPVTVHGPQAGDDPPAHRHAMGLAPMAVLPSWQRRGIGGRLVRAGLDACRQLGQPLVVVLGHAEYYPRFGFEPAAPRGLHYGGPEMEPYFFVAELEPGAAAGWCGEVRYCSAFDEL